MNVLNSRFGKLSVLSKTEDNLFKCKCDCGTILTKSYKSLRSSKSCGCSRVANLTNIKHNYLTPIKYIQSLKKWLCNCDCGNQTYVKSSKIIDNSTKSCGCYKSICKRNTNKSKNPRLSSANVIYSNNYKDGNLSFNDFLSLSQQNCHYCNSPPSQVYNKFYLKHKSSLISHLNGDFIYSGLDRIDSSKPHDLINLIPSCFTCNRFKSNLNLTDFYIWINSIKKNTFQYQEKPININKKQSNFLKSIIKGPVYRNEIDFNTFLQISQNNCHYCNLPPSNGLNIFPYSGLDRLDNTLSHIKDNLVPSCKHCNFAKSNMILEDFYLHIEKIKNNLKI